MKKIVIRKSIIAHLRVVVVIVALLVSASSKGAMPTVYTNRVINYHKVDLSPLFVWWDGNQGERPLTAWKHLEGIVEKEIADGWVCHGLIEGRSGLQYFLLKNPPRKDLTHYRELEVQLEQLERERATKVEAAGQPAYETWNLGVYSNNWGTADHAALVVPTENFDQIQQAKSKLHKIDGQIQSVRQEMADMQTKDRHFKIDAFALQMSRRHQRHPLFDFGYPPY